MCHDTVGSDLIETPVSYIFSRGSWSGIGGSTITWMRDKLVLPPSQNYCPTCVQTTRLSSNNCFCIVLWWQWCENADPWRIIASWKFELHHPLQVSVLIWRNGPRQAEECVLIAAVVPYRAHEMWRRKQLQTSPHEQGEAGSTWPSPGQHCLFIGALQQRMRAYEHGLTTTEQYKWDAKKPWIGQ
jgi:hypothetical protein